MFAIEQVSEKKGRGLVAKQFIKAGMVIDVAHALIIPEDEYCIIQDTLLYGYIFEWEDAGDRRQYAIALSPAEFINHSYRPNARYTLNIHEKTITFKAIKNIEPGEEITMNYNGHSQKDAPVWFEVEDEDINQVEC